MHIALTSVATVRIGNSVLHKDIMLYNDTQTRLLGTQ
jgi:hypothetical protein